MESGSSSRKLHQGAGDGDALLLAAGHLAGLAVHELFDLDELCRLVGLLQHLGLGKAVLPLQVLEREENVLTDGEVGIQGIVLKHQADAAVFGRKIGHVVVTEENPAGGGLLQTADQVQRGALAAAGRAQQADETSVRNLKAEITDGGDRVTLFISTWKLLGQMVQYNFHRGVIPPVNEWNRS